MRNSMRYHYGSILHPPVTAHALKQARWLLALVFTCWVVCSAVTDMSALEEKDRCKTPIGRLAVKLKLDSVYSGCRCVTPTLDLRDSCNLPLATAVGL
jgi:hypothetical protein